MGPKPHEILAYLINKIIEWQETGAALKQYRSLAEAEQAFKEWLWGTSHG